MIVPMTRVRIMGPRGALDDVLEVLQDAELVHLAEPSTGELLQRLTMSEQEERHARHLRRMVQDVEALPFGTAPSGAGPPARTSTGDFARWARVAGRARCELVRMDREINDLEAERVQVVRFEQFVAAFQGLLPRSSNGRLQSYHLILRGEDSQAVGRLRDALAAVLSESFALESARLPTGEQAALLLVPAQQAPRVERLLAESGVHELPMPGGIVTGASGDAAPALSERRKVLDAQLADLSRRRQELLVRLGPDLMGARAAAEDRLQEFAARERAGATPRSFVLEGWVPAAGRERVTRLLAQRFADEVVIEDVAREEWRGEEAPVVLTNPRFFRPFEMLTAMVPLPRYGSIDPTPFMAVFFPMFFGLILGDVGYGLVLAALAAGLHWRSRPGAILRSVAEILGPCAAFSIAFGVAFGEFFGDLGRHWFGQKALVMDREEALVPFLGLAVAIGVAHVVLGQILGIINAARGEPRQAIGRGAALAMVLFVVVALLAGIQVLPQGFFTPAVVALLIAFPVLVIAEGIIAPIEFLSTLSNMLSYARIMALGTASVMMAVVANDLAGSFGSVVVGLLFALLFHLVNFALGIFAPTIHGLRLHYVEFFGKFYSPGGQQYRPLGHWKPGEAHSPISAKGSP